MVVLYSVVLCIIEKVKFFAFVAGSTLDRH